MLKRFKLKLGTKIQIAIIFNVILAILVGQYVVHDLLGFSGSKGVLVNLAINTAIAFFFGLIVSKAMTRPIKRVLNVLYEMALGQGDLTKKLPANTNDEIGQLCESFNDFVEQLHEIISSVASLSYELHASVLCFTHMGQTIEQGAIDQKMCSEDMVADILTMMNSFELTVEHASNAQEGAKKAEQDAVKGGEVVRKAIAGIESVSQIVHESAETMSHLKTSSDKISQIIVVIDDIAEQTNLLALNAAIEAARAGEQGRGFAVVADEVRGLASRTTVATKEISQMITTTQNQMGQVSGIMQTGVEKVKEGVSWANNARETLDQLVAQSHNTSTLIENVSQGLSEQSGLKEGVSGRVNTIQSMADVGNENTRQLVTFFTDLSNQVERLKDIVAIFKL